MATRDTYLTRREAGFPEREREQKFMHTNGVLCMKIETQTGRRAAVVGAARAYMPLDFWLIEFIGDL